jgi:hypothetical protein
MGHVGENSNKVNVGGDAHTLSQESSLLSGLEILERETVVDT